MFGRKSTSYKAWKNEWKRYKKIPSKIDFANLGSTCDANNYSYDLWQGVGFNFASAPQDMFYDNQLLRSYGSHMKKGAFVFISISEFAFLVDKYATNYHDHKYYGMLEPDRICGYTKWKHFMIKHFPGIVNSRYIKQEIKQYINWMTKQTSSRKSLEEWSAQLMNNWNREFGWDDEIKLTSSQKETMAKSWEIFLDDIKYCYDRELIPIIVIPPFNKYLKQLLPKEILDECLWSYVEKIGELGITVIDFWHDTELEKEEYYSTPICLNEAGKKIFNMKLQDKLESKCGYDRNCAYYKLNNGILIPNIAFGTGVVKRFYRKKMLFYRDYLKAILISLKNRKMVRFLKNDIKIKKNIDSAIVNGFTLFDTGRLYGHSEKYLGEVIKKYNREKLFIITKISNVDLKRYEEITTVHDNLSLSLEYLNTDFVDAYLLHFPSGDWMSIYRSIEEEYKLGRVKSIGVCNFDIIELKELIQKCEIKPMICQVEIHPLNTKKELVKFCKDNNIVVMAHTPTGHMSKEIIDNDLFRELRNKYNKSSAQIIYRWHVQNGIIPIMTSTTESHLVENIDIFDFELSDDDVKMIDSLNKNYSFDKNNNKENDCPEFIYNI